MKIWAHRGCSQRYPENTMTAFQKAMAIEALTGIELDIQLTRDGEMVVIHDERVDRTTNGKGRVQDFLYRDIRRLSIPSYDAAIAIEHIPHIVEVLDLLAPRLKTGFLLNIELKNSVVPYPDLEEKIIALLTDCGLLSAVVFSSFNAKSVEKIRRLVPTAATGVLDTKASDCLYKKRGGCGAAAIHPYWQAIDVPPEELKGEIVRAWFAGHLYPERPTGGRLDIAALEKKGITDIFINEPEVYLT